MKRDDQNQRIYISKDQEKTMQEIVKCGGLVILPYYPAVEGGSTDIEGDGVALYENASTIVNDPHIISLPDMKCAIARELPLAK